jgi:hypothetical protein
MSDLDRFLEVERASDALEAERELAEAEAEGFDRLTTLEELLEKLAGSPVNPPPPA